MRTHNRALIVLMATLSLLMGSLAFGSASPPSADDGKTQANENSEAEISVTFFDGCTDFHVESSKDISFVSINFEDPPDFTYLKFEGDEIETEDDDRDGDDPDGSDLQDFSFDGDTEIKSVVVKSGSTMLVFNCPDEGEGEVEADPAEEPECSDGMDNDGDGLIDHPDDPGCETPDDDDERPGDGDGGNGEDTEGPQGDETCDDGVDNDGDGLIDDDDPDCNEGAQDGEFCDDGEDNDGDGLTDGEDPDCQDDDTEGPQGDETCDDGVDNDGDGLIDDDDPDCNEGAQDGEFCDDGEDNDGDGLTDGEDPDCQDDDTEGPQGDETCDDGVDNDGDGLIDDDDPDCNEGAQDREFCDDGEDNDGDGLTDGEDPDCQEPDPCTADAGDPGILTEDTLGQTAWDEGLQVPPVTEDPDADGVATGPVHDFGDDTSLEPATDEVSCAGDLLVDQEASPVDP